MCKGSKEKKWQMHPEMGNMEREQREEVQMHPEMGNMERGQREAGVSTSYILKYNMGSKGKPGEYILIREKYCGINRNTGKEYPELRKLS